MLTLINQPSSGEKWPRRWLRTLLQFFPLFFPLHTNLVRKPKKLNHRQRKSRAYSQTLGPLWFHVQRVNETHLRIYWVPMFKYTPDLHIIQCERAFQVYGHLKFMRVSTEKVLPKQILNSQPAHAIFKGYSCRAQRR